MASEAGHHASRVYIDQDGDLHLNSASFFSDGEVDIADHLEALANDTASGNTITHGAMRRWPVAQIAATGSAQGDGATLSEGINVVTSADGTKAVVLPAAAAGQVVIAINTIGADLPMFPASGDKINGGSADASITVGSSTSAIVVCEDGVDWWSIPTTPS